MLNYKDIAEKKIYESFLIRIFGSSYFSEKSFPPEIEKKIIDIRNQNKDFKIIKKEILKIFSDELNSYYTEEIKELDAIAKKGKTRNPYFDGKSDEELEYNLNKPNYSPNTLEPIISEEILENSLSTIAIKYREIIKFKSSIYYETNLDFLFNFLEELNQLGQSEIVVYFKDIENINSELILGINNLYKIISVLQVPEITELERKCILKQYIPSYHSPLFNILTPSNIITFANRGFLKYINSLISKK